MITIGMTRGSRPAPQHAPEVAQVVVADATGKRRIMPYRIVSRAQRQVALALIPTEEVRPGRYVASVILRYDDRLSTVEQDFQWGVLALNVPSASVRPWEDVPLHMAVLDDAGSMVCDAAVTLTVNDPQGRKTIYRTGDRRLPVRPIGVNPECSRKEKTERPDYEAHYRPEVIGRFTVRLVAKTENGVRELTDAFDVTENQQFSIRRERFPTRLFPAAAYPVTFRIEPQQDFHGSVVETVPDSFSVINISGNGFVTTSGDTQSIRWEVRWRAGQSYELGYTFDAPDTSPAFSTLGPLMVGAYSEGRPWQLAVDGTEQFIAFTDGTVPSGWTCISCASGDPFYQKFPRGNTTYGGTGGSDTHTHTMSLVSAVNSGATVETYDDGTITLFADSTETHTSISNTSVSSGTNLPQYRDLKVIRYNNTGSPSTLPVGIIALFDAAPTGNWTRYSNQDGYFVYGGNDTNVCSDACAATHTHTYSGTLASNASASGTTSWGGTASINGALVLHSHTFSGSIAAQDHTPSRVDALLYQTTATVATPPGILGLWSATPPSGWTSVSGAGGDYNGKLLNGASAYAVPAANGTHTPTNGTVTSTSATGTAKRKSDVSTIPVSAASHTHSTTVSFSSSDNLPPYFDAIIAKKDAATSVTISGTIYTDEGTTAYNCSTNNLTVAIRVNGAGTYSGTCSASNGTYSIGSVSISAGDIVTVFLDGETEKAATVTRSSNAAISGLDLYQNRLIVRDEDGSAIDNSLLGLYDADDDADIPFTSNSSALSVSSGTELHVWTGKTFTPGGSVTTAASSSPNTAAGDVHIAASSTLSMGTNALSVGGDYNNAGTFSKSTGQTTTFTATATGFSITPGTGNFDSLTFNGSGGGWSPTAALAVDVDLTLTAGTLSGTQNVTVTGAVAGTAGSIALTGGTFTQRVGAAKNFGTTSGSTAWSFSNLTFSNSAGTSSTVTTQSGGTGSISVAGTLTIGNGSDTAGTTLDLANRTWIFTGTSPISVTSSPAATLTINTSTIRFASTSAMTVPLSYSYYNLELRPNGSGSPSYTLGSGASQTLTVTNNLTLGDGTNAVTVKADTYNPATNVAGTVTINANATYTKGSGTFTFNGTSATTYTDSTTTPQNLGVVSINKTDTVAPSTNNKVTLASSITVDTLTIDGTAGQADTLNLGTSGYTLKLANAGSTATVLAVNGTLTVGTSTIQFAATNSGGSINVNTLAYSSLRVSGAETHVLTGNLSGANRISGNLTIESGATLDVVAGSHYALEVGGSWSNSGTFTARAGSVTLNGASSQTVTSGNSAFADLTIANTGTAGTSNDDVLPADALTISSALTLTSGELKLSTNNPSVSVAGNMTIGTSGIVTKGTGTLTFNGTTAVTYTDSTSAKQNIGKVSINKTDTVAPSTNNKVTLASSITVDTLTIDGTAGQADTLNLGTSGYTLKLANAGSTATVLAVNGTLTVGTSTVEFAATNSGGSVTIPALTYSSLTTSGNETYAAAGNTTVSGTLTISDGTFVAPDGTLRVGGSFTNNSTFTPNGGTVELIASSGTKTVTMAGGTFTALSFTGGATWELGSGVTASGTVTISAGTLSQGSKSITFGALMVNGGTFAGGTGALDVNGALTIASGTMTAPSGDTTVSGSFAHTGGTFAHNTGTIVLDGGDQTISGSTTFYGLKKTTSAARTLTFPASATQTITGTLTLKGASGALLSLRSSTSGTQWKMDPQGTRSVQYLDVQDSNNVHATKISTSGLHITDSGNNTGWSFPPDAPANLSGSALSSTSIRWTWDDASDDEEGFKLLDEAGNTILTVASANAVSATETGLIRGTIYTRTLVAYNANGNSTASIAASAPTNASPPTAPALANPASQALLKTITPVFTWRRSTDEDDGMASYALIFNAGTAQQYTVAAADVQSGERRTTADAALSATASSVTAALVKNTILAEGANAWKVVATDTAGNTSASQQRTFTVDVTKPSLTVLAVTPATTKRGADSDFLTTSTQPTMRLTLQDNFALRRVTLTVLRRRFLLGEEVDTTRTLVLSHALTGTEGVALLTPATALSYGKYRLSIVTEDAAGNTSAAVRTLEVMTPEKITQQPGTAPPSEQREQEIDEGKTPSKTPIELTLPSLEKNARVRREREAALFQQFLERFVPAATLARFNEELGRSADALTGRLAGIAESAREKVASALGFTTDQIRALADLARRSNACGETCSVRDRATAAAPALAALHSALPRFAGQTMLVLRTARDQTFHVLVGARKNRNQLAATTEERLNKFVLSFTRVVRWVGVGVRVALEGIRGKYDHPIAITNVTIERLEPTHAVITWETSRETRGKVNYGPSISYGEEIAVEAIAARHRAELVNLTPATKYYFEILADDLNGEHAFDAYYGFTTPAASE